MVSAVCCLRELSVLVQNIYWTDFSPTLGVVYCYGLVGYATVWKISVAPFMVLQGEGGTLHKHTCVCKNREWKCPLPSSFKHRSQQTIDSPLTAHNYKISIATRIFTYHSPKIVYWDKRKKIADHEMVYSPAAHGGRPLPMGWVYGLKCMQYTKNEGPRSNGLNVTGVH